MCVFYLHKVTKSLKGDFYVTFEASKHHSNVHSQLACFIQFVCPFRFCFTSILLLKES